MIQVLFPICTLNWRVNNYVSRQEKVINRRNESTVFIIKIVAFSVLYSMFPSLTVSHLLKPFSLIEERSSSCCKIKYNSVFTTDRAFPSESLRYRRKLAVVSRETPENTRNKQSQNSPDPGMAEE